MWHFLACVVAFAQPGPTSAEPEALLTGSWWLNGNGHYGDLVLRAAGDGKVEGTVFGQPLAGTFDAATKQLVFKRMLDATDATGRQIYTGTLRQVSQKPPRFALEGTFQAAPGVEPSWGKPDGAYPWKATATRHPSPAQDLRDLQGCWEVAASNPGIDKGRVLPKELGLNAKDADVRIRGNQLLVEGKVVASLANDVPSAALQKEVGFPDFRLLVMTLPDGRAVLCSYLIKADGVELAYPHTTSCHRGSGQNVYLKRPE
jgi:hypothetical protein